MLKVHTDFERSHPAARLKPTLARRHLLLQDSTMTSFQEMAYQYIQHIDGKSSIFVADTHFFNEMKAMMKRNGEHFNCLEQYDFDIDFSSLSLVK